MLTVNEAYRLFKDKFPDAKTDVIYDWGEYYTCGRFASGDMVDDEWVIDKRTGKIRERDFLEYINELNRLGDDFVAKSYSVKNLR